jgi:Mrp family chromosome partitioning ATPase
MARPVEQRPSPTPPSMGGYLQAIWRRKLLVVAGMVVGLLLGAFVVPTLRTDQGTFQATVRLKVAQLVSDTIVRERPQFDVEGGRNAQTNALQDVDLIGRVLDQLGSAAAGLAADEAAARLIATPVPGSSFVDLAFTDTDDRRASRIVGAYAKAWTDRRNSLDAMRLDKAMAGLEAQVAELQGVATSPSGTPPSASQQAEARQAQARLSALLALRDSIQKQQLFLGSPTAVVGSPVVTQLSAPVPRSLLLALGLLVGVFIGVGLSLVLEAVRPQVLAPADVERATGVPVIASVPRAGTRGGLPVVKRPFSPAAEGYRRVAGALERRGLGDSIRLVAIASADPHEGKSELCLNLAHSLALQGRDVLLVSADLRRPKLDELLGLEGAPGLAEWLEAGGHSQLPVHTVSDHLLVLPAGTIGRNPGELFTTRRVRQGLQPVAESGYVVLIDTPPTLWSAEAMTLTAAADTTLLVARARTSRWRAIAQLAEGLRRDGTEVAGMVLLGDRTSFVSRSMRRRYRVGYTGRHQTGVRPEPEAPPPVPATASRGRRGPGERVDGSAVDATIGLPGWVGPSGDQTDAKPEVYGAGRDRVP